MSYMVCTRARIETLSYAPGNMIAGTLLIDGKSYPYRTRGHLVHATGKHWSETKWRPVEGDDVLIDAEKGPGGVVIDSIEQFQPQLYQASLPLAEFQERLATAIPGLQPMNKQWRIGSTVDGETTIYCLRFATAAPIKSTAEKPRSAVVSAILAEGDIRYHAVDKKTGKTVPIEDVNFTPIILQLIGIPLLKFDVQERFVSKRTSPQAGAEDRNRSRRAQNDKPGGKRNKWVPGKPYRPEGMPEDSRIFSSKNDDPNFVPF